MKIKHLLVLCLCLSFFVGCRKKEPTPAPTEAKAQPLQVEAPQFTPKQADPAQLSRPKEMPPTPSPQRAARTTKPTPVPEVPSDPTSEAKVKIEYLVSEVELFTERAGFHPSPEMGLRVLNEFPEGSPQPKFWERRIKDIPKDPWDHDYIYQFPAQHSESAFDLFSLGPDGIQSGDDIGNW